MTVHIPTYILNDGVRMRAELRGCAVLRDQPSHTLEVVCRISRAEVPSARASESEPS